MGEPAIAVLAAEERQRIDALLATLAAVFAAEGRPGGTAAAEALTRAGSKPYLPLDERTHLGGELARALAHPGALPAAGIVAAAGDLIRWHYSGLSDGRIRPEIARHMQTAYLLGPEASAVWDSTVRVGLFLQSAGLDYPARCHSAEETFFILSGTAQWQVGEDPPCSCPPGSYVHHPSYVPHATVTRAEPVLAAWRWTGDIRFENYQLKG
ncbi:MAG: dimethylsulfonioproprionate lyase family protein [Pseudomonadota bacterium]